MRQYVLFAILAVAVLVVLLLVFFLARALFRAHRRQAEKGTLHRDLLLWHNLSSLVLGGEEARRAKVDLSSRINHLRELFAGGLKSKRGQHGDRDLPWFLVVGEPDAGKTTLFANAGLEFHSSVRSDSTEKQPILPWVGPFAYALDVGGRVFFDRWLEGSGAEWDETIALVARARRRPLDGVILCVPADALLVDEAALTREKTSLVSAELHRLVMRLGINVPVHVVITKCDMLLGWRELFAGLSEAERAAVFGWRHGDPEAAFETDEFDAWWRGAVGTLKARVAARLADGGPEGLLADRLSTATRAYLLPDAFESMKTNLLAYLARVFGTESWHGREHLMLSGVFFTSAADTGMVLSRDYAALAGMKVEEKPLVSDPAGIYGGHFIRNLLHDFVAGCRIPAAFTERALFRRQLPGYLLTVALLAIGVYWILLAAGVQGRLAERLVPVTEFYRGVARHFEQGDYTESPLFAIDEKGEVRLLEHEPLRSEPQTTRIHYLYLCKSFVRDPVNLTWGWWLSSLLRFNFDGSAGGSLRKGLFNAIQMQMAFDPIVQCFERYEDLHRDVPFDSVRRDVFEAYNAISARAVNGETCVDIAGFVNYVMPTVNPDVLQLLRTFYPKVGTYWRAHTAMMAYDLDYIRTERRLYGDFFRAWSDLAIYPETSYPVMRDLVTNSVAFLRDNRTIIDRSASLAVGGPTNDAVLAGWRDVLARQVARVRRVAEGYERAARFELAFDPEQRAQRMAQVEKVAPGADEPYTLRDPVRESIDEYRDLLRRDRCALEKDVAGAAALFTGHAAYAYYKTLGAEQLAARFGEIGRHLDEEAAALQADAVELRTGGMMRQLREKPKDGKPDAMESVAKAFVFDIQSELYGAATRALSDDHVTSPEKLGELLERETARAASANEALVAAAGRWAEDPLIAPLVAALRHFAEAQSDENRLRLLREYVDVHPRTERDIGELAATLAAKTPVNPALPLADVVGDPSCDSRFSPDGVRELLQAFSRIRALMHPKPPEKDAEPSAPQHVPDVPDYEQLETAVDEFVASYIDHLTRRIDRLAPRLGETWADFRAECVKIKPYAVNAVLQSGYSDVRDELKGIPDDAVSTDVVKMRDTALALVEGRLKLLTPDFSATCARQTAAWSLLSKDPVLASKCLRELPAKTLMSDYFALLGAEEKSRIPWWDDFFSRGLALAQGEALVNGVASLRKEGCKYLRFPLCRDPVVTDEVLTDEGLAHANDALLSCGCTLPADEGEKTTPPTAGKPAPEADESSHPVLKRVRGAAVLAGANGSERRPPIDLARGSKMMQLIDALTVHRFQTVWTLSVPPLAERLELQRRHYPDLPLSTVRFRYGEVSVGGKRRGEPVALDAKASVVLARGDLGDFDLRIRLKEFSDSPDFAAELDYPGPWAILRPYFAEGAVVREKDKAVLVPLLAADRSGLKSVFWVQISFSRPMPVPSEWPSTERWIDSSAPKRQNPQPVK